MVFNMHAPYLCLEKHAYILKTMERYLVVLSNRMFAMATSISQDFIIFTKHSTVFAFSTEEWITSCKISFTGQWIFTYFKCFSSQHLQIVEMNL